MRKFLVKYEVSLSSILIFGGILLGGISAWFAKALNYHLWWLVWILTSGIPITISVLIIIITNGWEWICPKCGFIPPVKLVPDLDGAHGEQKKETHCERCGTKMTIMREERAQKLSNLHSHQGLSYMLEFSPFDPGYKTKE